MLVKFSELKTVRKQATAYLPRIRNMTLTSNKILVEPAAREQQCSNVLALD